MVSFRKGHHRPVYADINLRLLVMPLFLLAPLIHAASEQAIAIVHGAIIDGRGGAPIRDGTILIRGRKIDSDRNISDTRRIELVVKEGTILDRQQLRFDRTKDPGFRTAASSAVNPQ